MSFDRPGLNPERKVTDTELNDALENDKLEAGLIGNISDVEHEEGQRSEGPQPNPGRRPTAQDVTDGELGQPVEPPD